MLIGPHGVLAPNLVMVDSKCALGVSLAMRLVEEDHAHLTCSKKWALAIRIHVVLALHKGWIALGPCGANGLLARQLVVVGSPAGRMGS